MKKTIAFLMGIAVTFGAAAINRFYLPDFTICPGETMQVAMILDNDVAFTAFQTDLILPEGLSVVQEDDEYLFELSGRKANDHAIISKLRDDGALRMVSFSIGVKPFSGNHGALVIIPLTAADDFTGPATIALNHSFFVTVDGEQYNLDSTSCEVQLLEQMVPGDVNGNGIMNMDDLTHLINYLVFGCQTSIHIENADLSNSGTVDMDDLTALINILVFGHQ